MFLTFKLRAYVKLFETFYIYKNGFGMHYVVPSKSLQTCFVQAFEIVVDS